MRVMRSRRGFTIVELLIVIVVIAILAAVSIVAYVGIQQKARSAALQSDLSQAHRAIMASYVTDDRYPESTDEIPKSEGTSYELSVGDDWYCLTATAKGLCLVTFRPAAS